MELNSTIAVDQFSLLESLDSIVIYETPVPVTHTTTLDSQGTSRWVAETQIKRQHSEHKAEHHSHGAILP
jgi:hypothetical protein